MKILTTGEYYGQMKREVSLQGVLLSEYDYLTAQTDWHYHENPYLMYVLRGNLYDINKKQQTCCKSGSLIFHNWQEAHYNTKETYYARGFHVEFPRNWFEEKKLDAKLWEGSRLLNHPQLHSLFGQLFFEFKCQDSFSGLSIELLLLHLCESIETIEFTPTKEPTWVQSLREILHEEAENLNLESLSQQLGIHPVHLSRAVPKYLGSSLGAYIRQHRIKQSLTYLLDKRHSLTDIANICGFSDQSHFTRTFKYYLHRTPSSFRKQVL
ncbi:MAG: AraC family transcriptional regulator [Saprospiraceae bacterium]|nr:AraC family transcriptional regulator [Saprospiraceae bacterium]